MRLLALPLLASLVLVRGADRAPAAVGPVEATPAEPSTTDELAEPALAPIALPPPAVAALRETGVAVPQDVVASVRRVKGEDGWQVRLARKGHLVALRHGGARTAGEGEAVLALADGEADPVVWETTKLDTLATVRGTLRLEGAGSPRALTRLVEAPVPAGRQDGPLHTCAAHEDGAGGFTVLCRVHARATAANVTGDGALRGRVGRGPRRDSGGAAGSAGVAGGVRGAGDGLRERAGGRGGPGRGQPRGGGGQARAGAPRGGEGAAAGAAEGRAVHLRRLHFLRGADAVRAHPGAARAAAIACSSCLMSALRCSTTSAWASAAAATSAPQ